MKLGSYQKIKSTGKSRVSLNGVAVDCTEELKYLGMQLDSLLKFDKHVTYVHRKVYTKLSVIGQLRQFISKNLAL